MIEKETFELLDKVREISTKQARQRGIPAPTTDEVLRYGLTLILGISQEHLLIGTREQMRQIAGAEMRTAFAAQAEKFLSELKTALESGKRVQDLALEIDSDCGLLKLVSKKKTDVLSSIKDPSLTGGVH